MSREAGSHVDIGDHSGVVPGRLFTWVDVHEHLSYLAEAGQWPEWLLEADAWWDQLALTVRSHATEDMVRAWLDRAFGRGSVIGEPGRPMLALDRPRGLGAEGIPVTLEAIDDRSPERRVPRLAERRTTAELAQTLPRPRSARFAGDVQVIAFHSFKGGVGRTVHAVALADQLARQGRRVLLIDADLEAPGITWMHQAQGGTSDISYEDVLALLHGTDDGGTASVTEIVRDYLAGQFVVGTGPGRLAILPATRRSRLGPPRVEPVDLLTHDRSVYFLTESLAEVASAAELDTVIIDLRAGASELSAPVLLDPRVQRVFVTTLSHQSLDGTLRMIGQLGAKAPALLGQDPAPAAVVTQYRMDVHDVDAEGARRKLSDALLGTLSVPEGDEQHERDLDVDTQALTAALLSPFRDELLALPGSWDEVVEVVRRCGLGERVAELAPQPSSDGGLRAEESGPAGIEELRTMLRNRAASLVFAERTGLDGALGFLSTEPLRRLIGDHRGSLPVTVVVGAKGAGKTFTYARMCAAGTWSGFAEKAGLEVLDNALVVPVLDPANLDQETTGERSTGPQDLRDLAAGGRGATRTQILRLLNEALTSPSHTEPYFWLAVWLRCMAIAGGSEAQGRTGFDAEQELLSLGRDRQLLFVFDGLEDFLQDLDGEAKRVALRALLVDVPEWLRSLRGRPLGLVVFVRRDLASWAIRQNLGQFLDRYDPYALRWDAQEALRLALWVAVTAKAVPEPPERQLMELSYEEITQALHPVWGAKLGSDSSREAWSDRWVPAALADFNDQVQARDVVRFLREAAKLSAGDERTDRLLVPTAMRTALVQCSSEKVKEIGQENKKLGDLLRGLERYAHEVLMPFSAEDVGLDANGIEVLRDAGALAADSDGRYRLPEIYRHALGFRTQGRARVVRR